GASRRIDGQDDSFHPRRLANLLQPLDEFVVLRDSPLDLYLCHMIDGRPAKIIAIKPRKQRQQSAGDNGDRGNPPEGQLAPQATSIDQIVSSQCHGSCLLNRIVSSASFGARLPFCRSAESFSFPARSSRPTKFHQRHVTIFAVFAGLCLLEHMIVTTYRPQTG